MMRHLDDATLGESGIHYRSGKVKKLKCIPSSAKSVWQKFDFHFKKLHYKTSRFASATSVTVAGEDGIKLAKLFNLFCTKSSVGTRMGFSWISMRCTRASQGRGESKVTCRGSMDSNTHLRTQPPATKQSMAIRLRCHAQYWAWIR